MKIQKLKALSLLVLFGGLAIIVVVSSAEFKTSKVDTKLDSYDGSTSNQKTRDKKVSDKKLREQLGQNLIVGIPGTEITKDTRKALRHIKPAGIVLYRRNYESNTQLERLIDCLQKISQEDTGTHYFIMLDEEPNGAERIGLFKNVLPLGLPDWKKIEEDISTLSDLGINVELAPIADFPFNNKTFIRRRVPAENIEDLKSFNKTFIDLLEEYGISATLKHFPGMGVFVKDPHEELPRSKVNQQNFKRSLNIFEDGITRGADFVMTAHAVYRNLDPDQPATFSSQVVKDFLINEIGFQGIVVTDDLSDMPLTTAKVSLSGRGIRAIKAGHHLIMFSHRLDRTKKVFDDILNKAQNDSELQYRIGNNYRKILNFKRNNDFSEVSK